MTTMEFIASVVGSIAWPAVGAFAVWHLRKPLGTALRERALRVSGFGVDLEVGQADEQLGESARELVEADARALPLQTPDQELLAKVEARAEMLPIVAVREGYAGTRARLHEAAGMDDDPRRTLGAIASHLKSHGKLAVEAMPAVEAMEVIKGLADRDNGSGLAISSDRADEFVGYMRNVLAKLRAHEPT